MTNYYRKNAYSYSSVFENIKRNLCCRRLKYKSKLNWEFVIYSYSQQEELDQYYAAKERKMANSGIENPKFKKVYELEKTASIYKP